MTTSRRVRSSERLRRLLRPLRAAAPAILWAAGCETAPRGPATPPAPPPASLAPAEADGETRVGIGVRQWLVEADPARIASTIAAWADDDAGGAEEDESRSRSLRIEEGVSIARGPASELVAVLASLGGTRTDLRVWHGQAVVWRDLSGVNLPRSTIAIAGGRPLAVPPGRLMLQMRGWVQPMEDGAACEVELAIRWKPERRASIGLDPSRGDSARWIGDLAELRSVGRGEVIIATAAATPAADADGDGPPVETPPTLGELILPSPAPGMATVLVIWPTLPDWLFPGEDLGSGTAPSPATSPPRDVPTTEDAPDARRSVDRDPRS